MRKNWRSSPTIALTMLVAVTAVWGATFVIVQNAISRMPVMDFLALRFSIATLAMFALRPNCLKGMTRQGLGRAILLGVAMGSGYIAQTYGLLYASASVSGFITGMFVILTPVLAWILLKHEIGRNTWIAVILATIGLGLLSLHGWAIGIGEALTLLCAIFFAFHIVGLGEWSAHYSPYGFALIQIATVAVISLIAAIPGGITLPTEAGVWEAIGITAILATALAFVVQTWAQSLVSATRAAVVMTMEPVFAGLFGVFMAGNQMTTRIIIGGICVVSAMLLVNLKPSPKEVREKATDSNN